MCRLVRLIDKLSPAEIAGVKAYYRAGGKGFHLLRLNLFNDLVDTSAPNDVIRNWQTKSSYLNVWALRNKIHKDVLDYLITRKHSFHGLDDKAKSSVDWHKTSLRSAVLCAKGLAEEDEKAMVMHTMALVSPPESLTQAQRTSVAFASEEGEDQPPELYSELLFVFVKHHRWTHGLESLERMQFSKCSATMQLKQLALKVGNRYENSLLELENIDFKLLSLEWKLLHYVMVSLVLIDRNCENESLYKLEALRKKIERVKQREQKAINLAGFSSIRRILDAYVRVDGNMRKLSSIRTLELTWLSQKYEEHHNDALTYARIIFKSWLKSKMKRVEAVLR